MFVFVFVFVFVLFFVGFFFLSLFSFFSLFLSQIAVAWILKEGPEDRKKERGCDEVRLPPATTLWE